MTAPTAKAKTETIDMAGLALKVSQIQDANGAVILSTQGAAITALTDNTGGATADNTLAAITQNSALTDNSGGTPSTTLAAISGTYVQAEIRNSIASLAARNAEVRTAIGVIKDDLADLAAKLNTVIAALQTAGVTA